MEILAKLLVECRISRDAIEDAIRHGYDLLLVQGDALDAVSRMLGEEVGACAQLRLDARGEQSQLQAARRLQVLRESRAEASLTFIHRKR